MIYLPDTNVFIAVFSGDLRVERAFQFARTANIVLSTVVLHELVFGASRSRRQTEAMARIDALPFDVIDFDKADARHAGEVRAALRSRGTPIGPLDTLIAGQALARDLTVITHNVSEFSRVPGLKVEDWQA